MILFVGDRPSKIMKPEAAPFEGAKCEKRLKEWIKFLCGDNQSIKIINRIELNFIDEAITAYKNNNPIIALGQNASKALLDIPHFKLPHPSFSNRKLNNKIYEMEELQNCKKWILDWIKNNE